MASPQLENGYSQIANEILEALAASPLRGRELRIVLFILRKTYGHSRKNCKLSYAEIGAATGIKRQAVGILVKTKLSPYRVIAVTPEGDRSKQTYEFNKNYDEWSFNLSPYRVTVAVPPEGDRSVPLEGDSSKFLPLDEKKKKKNIKKKVPAKKRAPSTSPLRSYLYPDWLNRELWRDYCQMRARIKKPIATEGTITRRLNKLKSLIDAGHDQTRLFELAIDNSWRDFYPPKGPIRGSTQDPGKKYPACRQCGQQADNIIRGQECPFCGGEA